MSTMHAGFRPSASMPALILGWITFARAAALDAFIDFKRTYGRAYAEGSQEHRLREELFRARAAEVEAHNAGDSSYSLAINHLSDRTEDELRMLRGFRPQRAAARQDRSSFLELGANGSRSCADHQDSCLGTQECCDGFVCGSVGACEVIQSPLPHRVEWREHLMAPEDQGFCGSCWAFAAAGALDTLYAKQLGRKMALSPQELLSCTPNPMACGGDGGCRGATPALAFKYIVSRQSTGAMKPLSVQEYTARADPCEEARSFGASFLQPRSPIGSIGLRGWRELPVNDAQAMKVALASVGSMAASIVGEDLHSYGSGVFSGCKSWIVDHAVLITGYGHTAYKDSRLPYWNIRNSWGPQWGENGYIRLKREENPNDEPCGIDDDPAKGVACKDEYGKYPAEQRVCGHCAILTSTAYPVGLFVPKAPVDAL